MQFHVKWPKCPFQNAANVTVQMQSKQVQFSVYDVLEVVWYANDMYFSKTPFFPPKYKLVHLKNAILMC